MFSNASYAVSSVRISLRGGTIEGNDILTYVTSRVGTARHWRRLQDVDVSWTELASLSALLLLPPLRSLRMNACRNITSLDGVAGGADDQSPPALPGTSLHGGSSGDAAPALEVLDCSGTAVVTLAPVAAVSRRLRELDLSWCAQLGAWSSAAGVAASNNEEGAHTLPYERWVVEGAQHSLCPAPGEGPSLRFATELACFLSAAAHSFACLQVLNVSHTAIETFHPLLALPTAYTDNHDQPPPAALPVRAARCPNLRAIFASDCPHLRSVAELAILQELQTLCVASSPQITQLAAPPSGVGCTRAGGDHAASAAQYPVWPALECLDVSQCTQLTSLDPLQGMPRLAALEAFGLRHLESLRPLRYCRHLRSVNVSDCRSLVSLEGLEGLAQLSNVGAQDTGITTLQPLRKCPRLEDIAVARCPSLLLGEVAQSRMDPWGRVKATGIIEEL